MTYKLFIDDDAGKPGMESWRSPPKDEADWRVAHGSDEACAIVINSGIPKFLELDHDLGLDQFGEKDTIFRFLNWLSDTYPDAIEKIEGYHVHSCNPAGMQNINAFMDSWKRSRNLK